MEGPSRSAGAQAACCGHRKRIESSVGEVSSPDSVPTVLQGSSPDADRRMRTARREDVGSAWRKHGQDRRPSYSPYRTLQAFPAPELARRSRDRSPTLWVASAERRRRAGGVGREQKSWDTVGRWWRARKASAEPAVERREAAGIKERYDKVSGRYS